MPQYKTALVTGAQKGIGAAIAKALINEGVNVVLNYLDDDSTVSSLVREATDKGLKAEAVKANVANRSEVVNLIDVAEKFGGLDYAVSNAAIYPRTPLLDMTEEEWKEVLDVNLKGCFFTLQAAACSMLQAAACKVKKQPFKLTSKTSFHSSSVISKRGVLG